MSHTPAARYERKQIQVKPMPATKARAIGFTWAGAPTPACFPSACRLEPVAIRVGGDLPGQFALRGYEDDLGHSRSFSSKRCDIESTQVRTVPLRAVGNAKG